MSYSKFVSKKIDVALRLLAGECGGGYTEAGMILASLLSGIAADLWPGDGIDRRRFIEVWARLADPSLDMNRISVPLLAQHLRNSGKVTSAEEIEATRPEMFGPGNITRILTSDEVDLAEGEVLKACSNLKLVEVRKFSHGAIFYKHVRSGLVHEFHLTEEATGTPMTSRSAGVSYSNWRNGGFPNIVRLIHFDLRWIADVIRSISARYTEVENPGELPKPAKWWIDGA